MRTINDHQVSPADKALTLTVLDEPGSGGANHAYEISGFELGRNASASRSARMRYEQDQAPSTNVEILNDRKNRKPDNLVILFQNGPIPAHGVNGITVEVLLAICADRLRCFQAGPFASADNGFALFNIEEAMRWLQKRTLDRLSRGVEGTMSA